MLLDAIAGFNGVLTADERRTPPPKAKMNAGPSDHRQIELSEPLVTQYWMDQFGVSRQALINAILAVGDQTTDVAAHFGTVDDA